jgi:menaquinone-9 beta-reductase
VPDALIAGGGPAGAAAACLLAAAGREVCVVEREPGPVHKMCGEFLSAETGAMLARLGVDPVRLGAQPVRAMRLIRGTRTATIRLPRPAIGLTRRTLDEALLDRAAGLGATIRRGEPVRALASGALALRTGTLHAPAILLATGKHDLRGAERAARPGDLVGFKMQYALGASERAALEGHVELLLFDDAYAGWQSVEDGHATLCLLVSAARLRRAGGTWPGLLADLAAESPALGRRLDAAVPLWERPLAIARVPYGYVHRGTPPPGLWRLGDQLGVIPSFCGDGIAIALHSGIEAAGALLRGESAASFHRRLQHRLRPRIGLAAALQRAGRSHSGQATIHAIARHWPAAIRHLVRATRVV